MQIYSESMLYSVTTSLSNIALILIAAFMILLAGFAVFKRFEKRFAKEL